MRLVAIAICSVISVGSAAAQPGVCHVTIIRAPDAVRDAVETWVRAEPRCTGTLEVRIVPTDGGYYLFARDAAGRIRERVVPDPQSAGVLVASWAADDYVPPPPPPPSPVILPPAQVVPHEAPIDRAPREHRGWEWGGWLAVMGMTSGVSNGLRIDADLLTTGAISFGIAGSATTFAVETDTSHLSGRDIRAVVYGADTLRHGRLSVRLALAVGAMQTSALALDWSNPYNMVDDSVWSPIGEAVVEAGYDLSARWGIVAGAVATVYEQVWITGTNASSQALDEVHRVGDIHALLGVRCRL